MLLIIALLALPYLLVISFPETGKEISEISKSVILWITILLLFLVFNQELKFVIVNIGDLIKRNVRGKLGPYTFETQQGTEGPNLSREQIQQLRVSIDKINKEKNAIIELLRHFFNKTIFLTIYRSQIELLGSLENSPSPIDRLKIFYEAAISRNPSLKSYPFEKYLGYLKDNFLITIDTSRQVTITPSGKYFLKTLIEAKIPIESFPA